MTFRGWPVEALEFFEGLEADNSKTYWHRHKDTYETLVRAPMEQLIEELAPEFGEGRIFRPYRDIRFSADKSPYKTNIAANLGEGYVQLSADGLGVGSGMWHMAPDQLERYREAVDEDARRRGARGDRGRGEGGRAHGRRSRDAEDGSEGLREGPPPHRAPPSQGPDRLAGLATGGVARNAAGKGSRGRVPQTLEAAQRVAAAPRRPIDASRAGTLSSSARRSAHIERRAGSVTPWT